MLSEFDLNPSKYSLPVIYFTKIYGSVIALGLTPVMLRLIGVESFGLIGSFTVLQSVLLILDAGLGGILTRQLATSRNDIENLDKFIIIFKKIV
mgnify:CR=1 FL=1